MPKIINERYKEFIEKGTINLFSMEELDKGLVKAGRSKFGNMARAFLIVLYYTGARPVELLQLKPTNFTKTKSFLDINIPTAKKGKARMVSIPMSRKYVTELFKYASSLFDEIYIFYELISKRTKVIPSKKTGELKEYIVNTDRVYYYIKKWIDVNPYFLRHSRMSSLMKGGIDMIGLQQFKGTIRPDSVMPYLHMSKQMAQKIGRKLK